MRAFVPYGVILAMCLGGASSASSEKLHTTKLRYSKEYAQYLCELQKLGGDPLKTLVDESGQERDGTDETLIKQFEVEEQLKERFKSAISNPYPPELQGYRPKSFELVEFLWSAGPCSEGRYHDSPKLPATFQCRLDRIILKDRETGKQFSTSAALVSFDFLYEDGDRRKLEDNPRPLPSEPYKTVGVITLKGTVDGKVRTMSHAWPGGAPAETVTSTSWGEEEKKLEFTFPADLPTVTAANASIFRFDLRNEAPYIRDAHGGPLKEYSFEVHGCRSQ